MHRHHTRLMTPHLRFPLAARSLATVLLLIYAASGQADESLQASSLDASFAVIAAAVEEGKVPGAVGLVSQNGRVLRAQAYGHADAALKKPMSTQTLCWIASLTKPITAAAAMKLVEEEKLNLDDTVDTHLPEFAHQKALDGKHYPITIRHLMSHSSGIVSNPPLRPPFFFEADWYRREIREISNAIAKSPLLFKPGSNVKYSNAAPYVLAHIIALRSGMPYHQYVQLTLLDPLDMRDTYFAIPAAVADRMAEVVRREDGKPDSIFFRYDPEWQMTMAMPDGGLFSTPADIVKFTQLFVQNDGRVLSKESVSTMLTEQAPGWGLGWALDENGSFHHTGSSGTLTWGDPRSGVAGALFCQIQDYKTKANESLKLREAFRKSVDDK